MEMSNEPQPANERRSHLHLRAIYPEASTQIDHLFRKRHDWAGSPIDMLAQRLVHETYPHLRSEDIRILVNAIERMHLARANQEARH